MMRRLLLLAITCFGAVPFSSNAQDNASLTKNDLFGNLRARHIGPALMSGRVIDLETHPTNNRVIYAGTAGGGVWKSSNGGATFQPIFEEHAQSIGVVKLDPSSPDQVIWVGTGEIWTRNSVSVGDGLYKSTDGGANWIRMGFEKSERISSIEINPNNPDEIYVGVLGSLWGDGEQRGVYKSTDGGKTWNNILFLNKTTGCSDLVMDPKNPDILYAGMWEFRRTGWSFNSGGSGSALYKSTDAGVSWSKIHNGFPGGNLGRIAVAVAPSNSKVLYAVLETEEEEDKGLYRSENGGESWVHTNGDFGLVVRPFYFSRIAVDPKNEDVVVKAGVFGSISRDGGRTFRNMGLMHSDIHDVVFDINDSYRLYAATDGGVYRSWDGGSTMEIVENLPLSQFYHISLDNEEPYNIYGGLQDNGSWWGPSSSPGGIEAKDWNSVGAGDGFRVFRHATKPIIYSEMQGAVNIWRYDFSMNRTKTVQPLQKKGDPKLRFNWNAALQVSPNRPDRLYVGSQFLHRSEDMGDTWEIISPDLTTNDASKQNQSLSGGLSTDNSGAENHCTIFTIAESSLDEEIIWVGTDDGNIQVTQDGGATWVNTTANIPNLPENTWCSHIEASTHRAGTAYAVFDGHTQNDFTPYVFKTTDFGQSWESIATGQIKGYARNIQEDLVKDDLLFLGTEFGLFITLDGGSNWMEFDNNMPPTAVHYIDLHPRTHDLVLGTHGRGIIIIDDISLLRRVDDEVLEKDFHFFDTEAFHINEQSGFGTFFGIETQFVGANPDRNARIAYYLKKRHTFGRMTMEIQDLDGNQIAELSPGKSKGLNIVSWGFRTRQPRVAKGKTLAAGGLVSPLVPAGTYQVVVSKGKERYRTEIEIRDDPESLLSPDERELKNSITKQLFKMSEELAYLVYQIDQLINRANQLKAEDSRSARVVDPFLQELTALKRTLVITSGDNYVNAAEQQLREKLADLYSKVVTGFDVPSSNELDNLKLLDGSYASAVQSFENMKKKHLSRMEKHILRNGLEPIVIQPFADFDR